MPLLLWREAMKRTDYFIFLLALIGICLYFKCDLYPQKNESSLLGEYQETLRILMETDTATANKFMKVMEQLNTGK